MILASLVRHYLHESVHRSASLATVVSAVGLTLLLVVPLRVRDKEVYYWGQRSNPAPVMAREFSGIAVGMSQTIWVFLPLLASAGLLAAALQKGWIELLLSKPMPRVTLLASVYLAGLLIWFASAGVICFSLAATFRWLLHVPALPLLKAFTVLTLFFAVELGFLTLVAVARPNVMIAAASTFAMTFISGLMTDRIHIARYFNLRWLERVLDALYYILPKANELMALARRLSMDQAVKEMNWMPLWSSALFGLACLAGAAWILERRSY